MKPKPSKTLADFKKQRNQWIMGARVDGLPIDPTSDFGKQLGAFETQRAAVMKQPANLKNAFTRIQILQDELSLMALELARVLSEQNAQKIQADKYQDFLKTCGDPTYFGRWMFENFKNDWVQLREQGLPMFEVVKNLLDKYRPR
jgi:hypothetical protein